MDIINTIDEFIIKYKKIVTDFSVIDNDDPITPEKLNGIFTLLTELTDTIKTSFSKHRKIKNNYFKKNSVSLSKYNNEIDRLQEKLSETLSLITSNHVNACDALLKKIENTSSNNLYSIEQLELDYGFFATTSEQNKLILTTDFEEAKKRYDYQKEKINESYLEAVKHNNKILDGIKEKIDKKYIADIENYNDETRVLLEKYDRLIHEKTAELKSLTSILEMEKKQIKEKYRQESASLNNSIKKILDEKNKAIDDAKLQYNKAISDADIEKGNKKQALQTKSQALLKEFVTKINTIDESTLKIRKDFEQESLRIKRDYYTNVYIKTKDFHSFLEGLYTSKNYNKNDKYTENIIKLRNKQYISEINNYKQQTKDKLLNLTNQYTTNIQSNRNNKNLLEIDKNFSIKNINNEEQFLNKFYQEKNSIYENDYNYLVQTTNSKFAQKANLLRCQSQIRNKLIERNHDVVEANYYREIETLDNKISLYNLEIKLTKDLYDKISKYLNEKYQNSLHLEEVINLLEIEKHKLLKVFNHSQYDYNINNITLAKEYGFKKVNLETEQAEKIKNLEVQHHNLLLEKNNISISFSIKKEELNEEFSKIKTKIINNYNLKSAKEKYVEKLKKSDVYYLKLIIDSYKLFFNIFSTSFEQLMNIISKDITITADNYVYLKRFSSAFLKDFIDLYKEIINNLQMEINEFIEKKINYIHEFNYKSALEVLKNDYLSKQTDIKENKSAMLDKMDSYYKTIENFKKKIYTLDNDKELIYSNNKSRKNLDEYSAKIINENNLKIRDYREKIEDYGKMIRLLEEDINNLNSKLRKNILNYRHAREKILFMEHSKNKIYRLLKKDIIKYKDYLFKEANTILFKHLDKGSNPASYKKSFIKTISIIKKLSSTSISTLDKVYDTFKYNNTCEIEKGKIQILREYTSDIKNYKQQFDKANLKFKFDHSTALENHQKNINEHLITIEKTTNYYNNLIQTTNDNYSLECANLKKLNEETINKFYDDYYAIEDNLQKILDYHKKIEIQSDLKLKQMTDKIIKANIASKNELNTKLKVSLKNKNEEIQHLPVAFKYNSRLLNTETKKKNEELAKMLRLAKIEYYNEKKRLDKKIVNYKNQFASSAEENNYIQEQNILIENRNNRIITRQALKAIEIEL